MKRILLILVTILLNGFVFGQDILITFTGFGETTRIDSIRATNLSTGQSVTFPGNGTLILTSGSGLESTSSGGNDAIVYPNPFANQTTLSIGSGVSREARLIVRNIVGQVVAQEKYILNPGTETFAISVQKPGLYTITVSSDSVTRTVKMLCTEGNSSGNRITYEGNSPLVGSGNPSPKGFEIIAGARLVYVMGDVIVFNVMSGNSTTILTTSPTGSTNYEVELTSCSDAGGSSYPVVKIGEQTWMAKNLAYLPSVSPSSSGSGGSPFYYVSGYEGSNLPDAKETPNFTSYGALYNWDAAQTACPAGWHLPGDADWTNLEKSLGMSGGELSGFGWRTSGSVGGKLKESGTSHWNSPNTGASNSSGFGALPGGSRGLNGGFINLGSRAGFWLSTQGDASTAMYRGLNSESAGVDRGYDNRKMGFSVRCMKNDSNSAEVPTVTTDELADITQTSATGGGNVTNDGGAEVTDRGICWNTTGSPVLGDSHTNDGTGTGAFTSSITGLTAGTPYYARAFATNSAGTAYGDEKQFTTEQAAGLPTVTTNEITGITQTTATGGGEVTGDGGARVTARGVCWNTDGVPVITDAHTSDGSGTGTFTSSITGLATGTPYYVRAYATNSTGTAYGEQKQFTSGQAVNLPTITTNSITDITQTTAKGGGEVTNDGGATVTARGVCWNTTGNPTTGNEKTSDGSGTGAFISSLSSLTAATPYYVRAYAINNAGTAYGEQREFTTAIANEEGTFDYEGKTYPYKSFGTQVWMTENLAYLPAVSPGADGSLTSPHYYVFSYQGNSVADAKLSYYYTTYGVLYNYDAAKTACPWGWHLPSYGEWGTLIKYLTDNGFGYGGSGHDVAKSMAATWGWRESSLEDAPGANPSTNNSSGFNGLAGGYRQSDGDFDDMILETPPYGESGSFWTATTSQSYPDDGWYFGLEFGNGDVPNWPVFRSFAFSVRCVRN